MPRLVVPSNGLEMRREEGDTASRAVAFDASSGSEVLELHVVWYEQRRLADADRRRFHPAGDPASRAYEAG